MSSHANPVAILIGWLAGLLGLGGETPQRRAADGAIVEIEAGEGPAWGSLSGLTAHPADPARLFAVPDKDSPPARIVEIALTPHRARVVRQITLDAPGLGRLDPEAISAKPDGGYWIASEGKAGNAPPNRLLEVEASGRLVRAVTLPEPVAGNVGDSGFEGVAFVAGAGGGRVFAAIQKPIAGDGESLARIACFDPGAGSWQFWHYPLERIDDDGDATTGLSELLHLGGERFAAIERDGRGGRRAIKWVTVFDLAGTPGAGPDERPPRIAKRVAIDLVAPFLAAGRKVEKEIEGLAIAADGELYALTDNDSEPGRPTVLLRLGQARAVFGG